MTDGVDLMNLKPLEYAMDRAEFNEHVEASGATLVRTEADGREVYACCYVGRETLMGTFCPATNSADLYLV